MSPRYQAALHEAAHCVIACLEGIPIEYVRLTPIAEVRAVPPPQWVNKASAPARRYLPGDANDPQQRAWIAPRTRVALAGPLVDAHVFCEVREECGDFEHATELVGQLGLLDQQAYLERLQYQTSTLLAQNWGAVLGVAATLLRVGNLRGVDVRRIVHGKLASA